MHDQPFVTVLMTSFNREAYIAEAIQSVLDSTYENFELIIGDDCSTDGTVAIIKKFAGKDPRISYYVNELNLGQFQNRNKAAYLSKGIYLMHTDSDDIIAKNGIEVCIRAMMKHSTAGFGMYYEGTIVNPVLLHSKEAIHDHFFKEPFLTRGPGGTVIKNDLFRKIGGFPTDYGPAGDMYYNLNAAANADMLLLPYKFMFYRRHENQEINNHFNYLYNSYRYLNAALKELNLPLTKTEYDFLNNKNKRRFLVNLVRHFIKNRNVAQTRFVLVQTGFGLNDLRKAIFH